MELTIHGVERIQGRTKMVVEDVLSIIRAGAVVSLGSADGLEYLLFYSPPDQKYKVAVTSEGRKHLVSVWEAYFHLPDGIKRPYPRQMRQARSAIKAFLLNRFSDTWVGIEKQILSKTKLAPPQFCVKLEVHVGGKVEYVQELGTLSISARKKKLKRILKPFLSNLEHIASIVEANKGLVRGQAVSYVVSLWKQKKFVLQRKFTHDDLIDRLHAAQP